MLDPIAMLTSALDELEGEDVTGVETDVVALLQLHGRLEAECARRAGVWKASGAWTNDGSRHPAASLARRTGRSNDTCRRILRVGKLALDYELTGKALSNGSLPMDHAAQLAQAIGDREELYPEYEAELVGPAGRLDGHRYARLLNTWKAIADDRLNRNREGESFERRKFQVDDLFDGVAGLSGLTDAEGAAIIRKAIEAFTVLDDPDCPGPKRTSSQITHDALIAALSASIGGPEGCPRRSIDVVVSYESLLDRDPVDLEQHRCEIVGVGPVDPSIIRRLAADSWLGRIIANGQGQPLDVGPQVRSFSRAQRRAIRYRDQECVWPGCHLRVAWSELDHIQPHSEGGTTSVDNGRCLCVRHHHLRHQGWHVDHDHATGHCQVTNPDGFTFTADPDPPPGGRAA
jgi:hypothetical protein